MTMIAYKSKMYMRRTRGFNMDKNQKIGFDMSKVKCDEPQARDDPKTKYDLFYTKSDKRIVKIKYVIEVSKLLPKLKQIHDSHEDVYCSLCKQKGHILKIVFKEGDDYEQWNPNFEFLTVFPWNCSDL